MYNHAQGFHVLIPSLFLQMFVYLDACVLSFGLIQMRKPLVAHMFVSLHMLIIPLRILMQTRVWNAGEDKLGFAFSSQMLVVSVNAGLNS